MPLASGTRLGPYEILAQIGAGGMGEVYRARDKRLGRDVAIKMSAEKFSERFEREARSIAALNHPNICALYDIGPDFLVMELIDGVPLKGPLPLEKAAEHAVQILDALDAAHRAGITHRDLKPANVLVTRYGIKLLDFGLAQAHGADSTVTIAREVAGTPAYMAPEQWEGKAADARSDIYAFGCVLYEMLTGKRAAQERTPLEPAAIESLVQTCLERDPEDRWQSVRDIKRALALGRIAESSRAGPSAKPSAKRSALWLVLAALAVAPAIALWAPWRATQPMDRPLVRLDVDLGADVSLPALGHMSSVAISPEGTRLVYASGATPRTTKLFTRRLDQPRATELPGTQGAQYPFFSPDGQWIGFLVGKQLNKISVEGGAAVPLADINSGLFAGASWGEGGGIVVSNALGRGLLRIPAGGGSPETVAEQGSGEIALALPQILPGGRAVLFAAFTALDMDKSNIEVLTLADHRRKVVARGGTSPRYLATSNGAGHLIYVNKATMFAIPFDLARLETRGAPVPVLDDVAYWSGEGGGQFDVSSAPFGHGTLVYRRAGGGASEMSTLEWVDQTGKREPLRAKPGVYESPSLSPDGKRVALEREAGGSDIWVYDMQRDAMTRLTFGGALYRFPIWSPDGQHVVFTSYGNGIFQARADGAGQPQALIESKTTQFPWSFTPDGKRLAYSDYGAGNSQIWTVPLEDQGGRLKAGKPEQFLKSGFSDQVPLFSPDGRWLAYESNESGRNEVYVRAFPPPSSRQSGKWQISTSGATRAIWSRSGHDLIYHTGDQAMAVSYTVKGDTFVPEKPRVWIAKLGTAGVWDVAPDGKRLLVLTAEESKEAPKPEHEVVFLENFFDYLRQRVPVLK